MRHRARNKRVSSHVEKCDRGVGNCDGSSHVLLTPSVSFCIWSSVQGVVPPFRAALTRSDRSRATRSPPARARYLDCLAPTAPAKPLPAVAFPAYSSPLPAMSASWAMTWCGKELSPTGCSAWFPRRSRYTNLLALENLSLLGRHARHAQSPASPAHPGGARHPGLEDRAREPVEQFSGGVRRRVNCACGIVHQPRVLPLDEPTVGVDPSKPRAPARSGARPAEAGACVLYTTHYMKEAETLCDHLAIVDHWQHHRGRHPGGTPIEPRRTRPAASLRLLPTRSRTRRAPGRGPHRNPAIRRKPADSGAARGLAAPPHSCSSPRACNGHCS